MLRSRPVKGLLVLLCALAVLLVGASASASGQIHVLVDGHELTLPVPARIEQERVLVPLRSISEALGASVYWFPGDTGSGEVWIDTFPRFFSSPPPAGAPAVSQNSRPDFLGAVGASSALTQYLAAEQANSLTGKGPILVRFELLDVQTLMQTPPPSDLTQLVVTGFQFAVRMYYVQPTESTLAPPLLAFQEIYGPNQTPLRFSPVTPELKGSWYEDVTFVVTPKGQPSYQKTDSGETAIYGAGGWEVDVKSRTLVNKVEMDRSPFVVHGSSGR